MRKAVFIDVDGFALVQFRSPLLRRLHETGVELVVCSGDFRDVDRRHLEEIGCRVCSIPLQRTGLDPRQDRRTRKSIHDFLVKEKPDTVVARAAKSVAYALPEARKIGIPNRVGFMTGLGTMFHPGSRWERMLGLVGRRVILKGLRSANHIWVLNEDDKAKLETLKAAHGNVRIQRMDSDGIDTDRFTVSALPDRPTFCFVGRLLPAKGARVFLDAAREIRRKRTDIDFVVAGEPDKHRGTITTEELGAMQQEGIISYEGFVDDLENLMARSSCLVLPSFHEGRPRTVIESLSSGRPVIVSDAVGCRDAIQNGKEGIIVPKGDPLSLAQAIMDLADDPGRMEAMGKNARMTAVERYDENKVVDRFMGSMGDF